jgi:hypothetical protein
MQALTNRLHECLCTAQIEKGLAREAPEGMYKLRPNKYEYEETYDW